MNGRVAEAAYRAALKFMPHAPVAHKEFGKFLEDQGLLRREAQELIKGRGTTPGSVPSRPTE